MSLRNRVGGMAAAEFALIVVPLLLTGLAVLELARWHTTRLTVGYALLEAARGGQDGWRDPARVAERFETAVLPLWGADADPQRQHHARQALQRAVADLRQQHQLDLWQIRPAPTLYPTDAPASLVLELTWWHRPWVPGMQALLRQLGRLPPSTLLRQGMARSGWLPIRQRLALEWHLLPGQPVPGHTTLAPLTAATFTARPVGSSQSTPPWNGASAGVSGWFTPGCDGPGCTTSPPAPEAELCGSILCCAP